MSECVYCGQNLPPDFNKKALKKYRQRRAMMQLKASGVTIGRPRKANYDLIREAWRNGCMIKEIAENLNVTTTTVHRALKGYR